MANDFVTIADMLADALDLSGNELTEIRDAAPLMSRLPALTSSNGDTHKYPVNESNPVVGFRAENVGREFDHSIHRIDTATLKILDFSWMADKAVADRWRNGGAAAFIAREGLTHIRSAMYAMENQFLNGTIGGDSAGFAGLANSTFLDAVADVQVYDATGTTADTASSVYLLRVGPSEIANVVMGDGISLGSTVVQNFVSSGTLNLPVYYTPACTWVAAQLGAKYSAVRVANLTDDSGKGLTDDVLYSAMKLFPAGMGPNLVVANQRTIEQLRKSRTATNATGAPAPTPTMTGNGVPMISTDALSEVEAILA
jgi:hypothetical protein